MILRVGSGRPPSAGPSIARRVGRGGAPVATSAVAAVFALRVRGFGAACATQPSCRLLGRSPAPSVPVDGAEPPRVAARSPRARDLIPQRCRSWHIRRPCRAQGPTDGADGQPWLHRPGSQAPLMQSTASPAKVRIRMSGRRGCAGWVPLVRLWSTRPRLRPGSTAGWASPGGGGAAGRTASRPAAGERIRQPGRVTGNPSRSAACARRSSGVTSAKVDGSFSLATTAAPS